MAYSWFLIKTEGISRDTKQQQTQVEAMLTEEFSLKRIQQSIGEERDIGIQINCVFYTATFRLSCVGFVL